MLDEICWCHLASEYAAVPNASFGVRIGFALAFEQFFATDPLTVISVPDFQPIRSPFQQVRIFPLRESPLPEGDEVVVGF